MIVNNTIADNTIGLSNSHARPPGVAPGLRPQQHLLLQPRPDARPGPAPGSTRSPRTPWASASTCSTTTGPADHPAEQRDRASFGGSSYPAALDDHARRPEQLHRQPRLRPARGPQAQRRHPGGLLHLRELRPDQPVGRRSTPPTSRGPGDRLPLPDARCRSPARASPTPARPASGPSTTTGPAAPTLGSGIGIPARRDHRPPAGPAAPAAPAGPATATRPDTGARPRRLAGRSAPSATIALERLDRPARSAAGSPSAPSSSAWSPPRSRPTGRHAPRQRDRHRGRPRRTSTSTSRTTSTPRPSARPTWSSPGPA